MDNEFEAAAELHEEGRHQVRKGIVMMVVGVGIAAVGIALRNRSKN